MKFLFSVFLFLVTGSAFAAPSQISVIVDGQQYQCLGTGGSGSGSILSCYCTSGNNQLYVKAIFASGQKLEKMLFDYGDIESCQKGLSEHPTCRKSSVSGPFFQYCACEPGNNQLMKYIFNQEGSEIDRQLLFDYGDPESCNAGLKANTSCLN